MHPARLSVYSARLLAFALVFSQYQVLKAGLQRGGGGGGIVGITTPVQNLNGESLSGAAGGGIIGVTDQKPPAVNEPGVYKLEDGTETIEFIGNNKVKITKERVAFITGCRGENGVLSFRRAAASEPERFKRWDQVLILEGSSTFYYSESTLAYREDFHNRVRTQLDLLRRLTVPGR